MSLSGSCQKWLSFVTTYLMVMSWLTCLAAGSLVSEGQEPWLIVWKKGVDGHEIWNTLCPSINIGDDPQQLSAEARQTPTSMLSMAQRTTAQQLVLNCSSRFTQLFNGLSGHFTLKELDYLKSQFKNSIDFVVSDKAIQVDTPPNWVHEQAATEDNYQVNQQAPASLPLSNDTAPLPQRQLLSDPMTQASGAQEQDGGEGAGLGISSTAAHRMLPEEFNATWGLDILDQGHLPLDSVFHYTYNGTGVHVYVLDTGIRTTHTEFRDPKTGRSRARHGYDAVSNTNSSEDCHGHGTHVAAVVGGNVFGVAKDVTLHAVRVLACDGTAMVSSLLRGLEWVAKNHIKPAVVQMSIEGAFSSVVNQAIEQLVKIHHIHVVASSGNSGKDACRASPASAPSAITVSAIDDKVSRWAYANWGACVDVFAPGVAILSAVSNAGDSGTALKTGTSMAAPFVTGVVAAYLGTHPGASPDEVQQKLYQSAVRGSVTDDAQGFGTMFPSQYPDLLDISSTPNRLLQNNLTHQAMLNPGQLIINSSATGPQQVNVTLSQQPSETVLVNITVPAAWDGRPIADVYPAQMKFTPQTWNVPQQFVLLPKAVCEGDFYVELNMEGAWSDGYPALHTILVRDSRVRSGDTASMARVITHMPFNDTGDTTAFTDNYGCQATDNSPDVIYSYTPSADMDAAISTCGSGFDTKLLVSSNLNDPSTYMCNDDDRSCTSNTACSRLDVSFKAGTKYYIVVDGYSGASGEYQLSITCSKCPADTTTPQQSSSAGSSLTNSNMLIQALLHLARVPSSRAASPSPGPSTPTSPRVDLIQQSAEATPAAAATEPDLPSGSIGSSNSSGQGAQSKGGQSGMDRLGVPLGHGIGALTSGTDASAPWLDASAVTAANSSALNASQSAAVEAIEAIFLGHGAGAASASSSEPLEHDVELPNEVMDGGSSKGTTGRASSSTRHTLGTETATEENSSSGGANQQCQPQAHA